MNKHASASFLSIGVLGLSLGVLWLGYALTGDSEPDLMVRKLDVATSPPPPPPPPQSQQSTQDAQVNMQVEGSGASVDMARLDINSEIDVARPDMPNVQFSKVKWDAPEIDWEAYSLSDLDRKPSLITPVKIRFPKKLKRQGVDRVTVKLDVMIDEDGDVTLINIVENPHHELNREIQRFVKGSKFTAPFKHNEAVRARFIWPVEIEA